jgi:hypothetical protein
MTLGNLPTRSVWWQNTCYGESETISQYIDFPILSSPWPDFCQSFSPSQYLYRS